MGFSNAKILPTRRSPPNGRPCPAKCRRRSCAAAGAGWQARARGPGGRHRAAHGARFPAGSGCGQHPHQGAGTQHAVPAPGASRRSRRRGVRAGRGPGARLRRAGGSHGNHPNAAAGGLGAAARDDGPAQCRPPAPRRRRRPRRSCPAGPACRQARSQARSQARRQAGNAHDDGARALALLEAAARLPPRRPPPSRPRPG